MELFGSAFRDCCSTVRYGLFCHAHEHAGKQPHSHAQGPGVRVVHYKVVGLTELNSDRGLEVDATYLLFQCSLLYWYFFFPSSFFFPFLFLTFYIQITTRWFVLVLKYGRRR